MIKEFAGGYQSAMKVIENIKTLQYTIQTTESNLKSTEQTLESLRETKGEQDPKVEATILLIKHGKNALESLRAEIVALRKALVMEQLYIFGENVAKDCNVLMIKVSALHAAVAHERARSWNALAANVTQSSNVVGKRQQENPAFLKQLIASCPGWSNPGTLRITIFFSYPKRKHPEKKIPHVCRCSVEWVRH